MNRALDKESINTRKFVQMPSIMATYIINVCFIKKL